MKTTSTQKQNRKGSAKDGIVFIILFLITAGIQGGYAITRGPFAPGLTVNIALAGSSTGWTNSENSLASDNIYVQIPLNGLNISDQYTDYLQVSNFGISVPEGATINGILVEIERADPVAANTKDNEVKILKNGVAGIENKARAQGWSGEAFFSYGGAADLWSETWTPADINSANFGVVISVKKKGNGNNPAPLIDHIRISITYTPAPLPIQLLSFTAKHKNNEIDINWATATEINNEYFAIEKSSDAINWKPIVRVEAAGNSTSLINYSYVDKVPFKGVSYYRLKQTDFDGNFVYFNTESVENYAEHSIDASVFPNPSSGNFTLNFDKENNQVLSMEVYNILGEKIQIQRIDNSGVDLRDMPDGVYFLKVNRNSDSVVEKIVKKSNMVQ